MPIFQQSVDAETYEWLLKEQKGRIAHKLQNPRIDRITFHTLRHFFGTMEYHKTKDILHV